MLLGRTLLETLSLINQGMYLTTRIVKCDGKLPCSYCLRRQRPATCRYSPQQRRRAPAPTPRTPSPSVHNGADQAHVATEAGHDSLAEEETEVPREARLLCDAQGKLSMSRLP